MATEWDTRAQALLAALNTRLTQRGIVRLVEADSAGAPSHWHRVTRHTSMPSDCDDWVAESPLWGVDPSVSSVEEHLQAMAATLEHLVGTLGGTAMQPLRHVTCTQHPVHNLAGVAIDVWVACPHPPEARDLNRWFAFTTTMRFLDDTGTRWERKVTAHLDSGKDDVAGEEV